MPAALSRLAREERLIGELVARGLAASPHVAALREIVDQLAEFGSDRAVFAHCVLTLELALLKDERARAELPERVEVLLEAFHDPRLANVLVAGSPELTLRWAKIRPVVAEFVSSRAARSPARPPAPTPLSTAPTARLPPLPALTPRPMPRLATPIELITEIQEILEEEPPLSPTPTPPPLSVAGARLPGSPPPPPLPDPADVPLDPETRAFWIYAEQALGRVPNEKESVLKAQAFAVERGADRTHLVRFAHDLIARFPRIKQARALSALTLLYVAGQEKERGLLGVNRERLDLLRTGLSLLGDPVAAAQVTVLFESDGTTTRLAFAAVLEVVRSYLAFCLRARIDPRLPESAAQFTTPA